MDGLLINGQLYYVANQEDFLDLVLRYMGSDAETYLRELLKDYECEHVDIDSVYEHIESARATLEDALDVLGVC